MKENFSFQLDGIQLATTLITNDENIIPYSNTGYKYYKYKFLERFIPGDHDIANDTISSYDYCLLHKLISSSLDVNLREDESDTCPTKKVSQGKR